MDVNKLNQTLDRLMISPPEQLNSIQKNVNSRSRTTSMDNVRYRRPSIDNKYPHQLINSNSGNLNNEESYKSNNSMRKYSDSYHSNRSNNVLNVNQDNYDGYINDPNNRYYYNNNQNFPDSKHTSNSSGSSLSEIYYNGNGNTNGKINNGGSRNKNMEKLRIKTHTRRISNSSDSFIQQQQSYSPNMGFAPPVPSVNGNIERRGSQDTMGSSLFSPDSSTCSNRNSTLSIDDTPQTASIKTDISAVTLQSLSVDLVSGNLSRISTSGFIKSSKRHFYVLDAEGLYYFKSNEPFARAKGFIPFDKNTKLHDIKEGTKEKENRIIELEVYKSNKVHLVQLQAEDPEDRNMWHRAIRKIIIRQKYVNEALPPLPPMPPQQQSSVQPPKSAPSMNQYQPNANANAKINPNPKIAYQKTKSQQQTYLQQQKLYQQQQQASHIYTSNIVNISDDYNSLSNNILGGWISPDMSNPEFIPNDYQYNSNYCSNGNSKSLDEISNPLIATSQFKRRPSFDVQMLQSNNSLNSRIYTNQ